jgi:integrase
MPAKIIKVYKGTNIIKVRLSGNRLMYGYRWTFEGRKYTRAQWETKEAAETELAKFKAKMRNPNRLEYDDVEITLDMLLLKWVVRAKMRGVSQKRINETSNHVSRFKKVSATDKLRRITEDDLLLYQRSRLTEEKPKHNHTINKELAMIRTVLRATPTLFPGFNWQPPAVQPLPELHKGREVLLSRDELKRILRALKEPVSETDKPEQLRRQLAYDAIVVGIESAMRISEIVGLKKSQVHFERGIGFKNGFIIVNSAKTHKLETLPMTPNMAEILKRRSETNKGQYLFKNDKQTCNPVGQKIRRAMKNACKRAGIAYGMAVDGAVFHTLRHSTTTELVVNQKMPIPTVMKLTRHSSRTMIMRYTHPTPQAVEEVQRLAEIDLSEIESSDPKEQKTS